MGEKKKKTDKNQNSQDTSSVICNLVVVDSWSNSEWDYDSEEKKLKSQNILGWKELLQMSYF